MTRAVLRLSRGRLVMDCPDAGIDAEPRKLPSDAAASFRRWALTYRRQLGRSDNRDPLLKLGFELFNWLDGDESWLARLLEEPEAPLVLELATGKNPDALETLFLEGPWELTAEPARKVHLALEPHVLFCPTRRFGKKIKTKPPKAHRLSLVFMAAEPRDGGAPLRYEAEETAIIEAAGTAGLDLVTEDSGSLEWLADCMARYQPIDVLHLSGHGRMEPEPHLALEDEYGDLAMTKAGQLNKAIRGFKPGLAFISACETAAAPEDGEGAASSFAAALARASWPAALAWADKVGDREATRFAACLYHGLARGDGLTEALAWARLSDGPSASPQEGLRNWHLARLYLGVGDGGPLTAGPGAWRLAAAGRRGHQAFLDAKDHKVPVASQAEFVGRRRHLQDLLRAFRAEGRKGAVILGMGGHGKSSLAARLAHRLPDHALAVVWKDYGAADALQAIERATPLARVQELIGQHRGAVAENAGNLKNALLELLTGPFKQLKRNDAGDIICQPLLLVIDDFERVLKPPAGSEPHRLKKCALPVMRAIMAAFDTAETDSRLLITSRYRFCLPDRGRDLAKGPAQVYLPAMEDYERAKQAVAKARVLGLAKRPPWIARCRAMGQGNPRLQDLLFKVGAADSRALETLLDDMARALETGQDPKDDRLAGFFQNLALDALLAMPDDGERALLRAAALFPAPVPRATARALAETLGLTNGERAVERLTGFGLWDAMEDLVAPRETAIAVNALVRPKLAPLTEAEAEMLARSSVDALWDAWRGAAARRPGPADLTLAHVANLAGRSDLLSGCAEGAVRWLADNHQPRACAELGLRAIDLMDGAGVDIPPHLLRITGESCQTVGLMEPAKACLARAADAYAHSGAKDPEGEGACLLAHGRLLAQSGDLEGALARFQKAETVLASDTFRRERLIVKGQIARIYVSKGQVDQALALHQEMLLVFEELEDRRERAVTLGAIARIYVSKGQVDQALALHQEMLLVFEELEDRRSRAVTLGDIARIYVSKGQVDQALALHQEMLLVFEELEDRRSRAVTLGDIARIYVSKGQVDQALALHQEMLLVFEELEDRRSRAVTLGDIARVYVSKGQVDQALALHQEELKVYEELEDRRSRAVTLGDIARIYVSKGQVDQALALHQEELKVYEELEDRRSRAVTLGNIAQIYVSKGQVDQALALHQEELKVYEELEDRRSRAVTLGDIARIYVSKGQVDEALALHQERLKIDEALGDVDGKAHTLWSIAAIELKRGELDAAVEKLAESYKINCQIGRLDGICMAGKDLGAILCQVGHKEQGLPILKQARDGFERLGWEHMAEPVRALIARFETDDGESPVGKTE